MSTTTTATDHPARRPSLPGARRHRRGLTGLLGLTALALATVACADGDDPERAGAESVALDVDAPPETRPDDDGGGTGGDPGGSSGQGSSLEPSSADNPQDQDLDIEMRHPGGTILRVNRLAFEGNDIAVDVEVINGHEDEVTFAQHGPASEGLRLVDDAGETYNFIYPTDNEASIDLAPGDSLEGTLRFRGPLYDQPDQVMLVTNIRDDEIAGFNLEEEDQSTWYPTFVVPFDLVWG